MTKNKIYYKLTFDFDDFRIKLSDSEKVHVIKTEIDNITKKGALSIFEHYYNGKYKECFFYNRTDLKIEKISEEEARNIFDIDKMNVRCISEYGVYYVMKRQ